jgi:folate-dependent tRNA-U54 methylase TrmFO/GidA
LDLRHPRDRAVDVAGARRCGAHLTGEDSLAFFDAIAPIVHRESIDFDTCWMQSRYDKGDGADYINCPMNPDEYESFIAALLSGEKTDFKEWEKSTPYFEGCLPIEVMAARGIETLRFGPMKPVGLHDPRKESRPHAVVQLRQDNALGTLWNMVGFQTKLKHGEQTRIFRMIPGLQNASFARLGGLHRNTFLNSPRLLDPCSGSGRSRACALRARWRAWKVMSRAPRAASSPVASPPPKCSVLRSRRLRKRRRSARFWRTSRAVRTRRPSSR